MRVTTLASAVVIALAATIATVSAADQSTVPDQVKTFRALNGVKAVPMSSAELNAVRGMDHHFQVRTPGQGLVDPNNSAAAPPFSVNSGVERFGTDWHNEEVNGVPG